MHKAIEKVEAYKEKTIRTALNKAREARAEALGSFNDTGYDRYYNKAERMEREIEELEEYLDRDKAILEAIEVREKNQQKIDDIKKTLKNKLFYLMKVIPECSEGRSIQEYLETL